MRNLTQQQKELKIKILGSNCMLLDQCKGLGAKPRKWKIVCANSCEGRKGRGGVTLQCFVRMKGETHEKQC